MGFIWVKHRVSDDPNYCEFNGPDDGFMERSVCRYLQYRDRHGKGGKIERKLPKCTLFGQWLGKEGAAGHARCEACKAVEKEAVK